jgi:hypothetical protein
VNFAALQEGTQKLGVQLVGVTLVLMCAGLIYCACQAYQERGVGRLKGHLVRMVVAVTVLSAFATWTAELNDAAMSLVEVDTAPSAYETAILKEFGSQSAGQNWQNQQSGGSSAGQLTLPQQSVSGVKITRYGYELPGDPNYDSKSAQGIGAFPFDSAPGSLGGLVNAAALSPDVVAQYNLHPGDQFPVTIFGGQQITVTYADNTASDLTGRVDLYDPSGQFSGIDGAQVTSIGGAATGLASGFNLFNPSTWMGSLGEILTHWLASVISGIALFLMYVVQGIQKALLMIEVAVAPIFIGLLCIRPLASIATRFFMAVVATCMWPIGIAVCNLITRGMIDLAVATAASVPSFGGLNLALAGIWWIAIGLWVIGSGIFAPFVIAKSLMSRSSTSFAVVATGLMSGLGAGVSQGASIGLRGVGGIVSPPSGGNGQGPISPRSASFMSPVVNYARRPIDAEKPKES